MQGWMNDEYESVVEEWEVWLTQKEKQRWKTERLKQHIALMGKLLNSARVLHNSTKPRPWTGGTQVIDDILARAEGALAGGYTTSCGRMMRCKIWIKHSRS